MFRITRRRFLEPVEYRRAKHVIGEVARTVRAAAAVKAGEWSEVGRLMYASHASLRDDYEASCPEIDFLVEQARAVKGVYGARMTGGGFGGCIVALAQPRSVETLSSHLTKAYRERFGSVPAVLVTAPASGASVME